MCHLSIHSQLGPFCPPLPPALPHATSFIPENDLCHTSSPEPSRPSASVPRTRDPMAKVASLTPRTKRKQRVYLLGAACCARVGDLLGSVTVRHRENRESRSMKRTESKRSYQSYQHLQRGHQWKPLQYLGFSTKHPFEGPGVFSLVSLVHAYPVIRFS